MRSSGKKIFTINDLRKLLHIPNDNTAYQQVQRLLRSGTLNRAGKGLYYLADDKPGEYELANALYPPSYISRESALNYYGILMQSPYIITSVTPRRAQTFEVDRREYAYYHMNSLYYSDYRKEGDFLIATPEKALVDMLFFVALGKAGISWEELDIHDVSRPKLRALASKIRHPAFQRLFSKVMK